MSPVEDLVGRADEALRRIFDESDEAPGAGLGPSIARSVARWAARDCG